MDKNTTNSAVWKDIFMANLRASLPDVSVYDIFSSLGTFDSLDLKQKVKLSFWPEVYFLQTRKQPCTRCLLNIVFFLKIL